MMKKTIVFLLLPLITLAQEAELDSLRQLLNQTRIDTTKVRYYQELATRFESVNVDSAQYYAQRGYVLSKENNYVPGQIKALQQLAYVTHVQLQFSQGVEYAQRGLQLAIAAKNDEMVGVFSNTLGILYDELGNYPEAVNYYQRSLQVAETQRDSLQMARVLNNIGVTYYQIENYDQSLNYYQQALRIYQDLGNIEMIGRSYSNLGSIYYKNKDYLSAIDYSERSLAIARKENDTQQITYNLYNLAELHYESGDYRQSFALVQESIKLAQQLEDYSVLTMGYQLLGKLTREDQRYDEARAYLNQAIELARQSGNVNEEQKVRGALVELDSLLGNYERAFLLQGEYYRVRDSLLSVEKIREVEELQTVYETDKKTQKITFLEQERELQAVKEDQMRQRQFALVTGSILLLGLLGITYNRFRLKRRALGTIQIQKQAIEEKNAENELLIREIHHRVKNNLQIILSLLNTQATVLHDPQAVEVIQESQNRVRSMALIHEKLYQTNNFTRVPAEPYLQEMAHNIARAYRQRVQLQLDVAPVDISMTTAVPLGLIVTELLTNAFKYAFGAEQTDATLSVSFSTEGLNGSSQYYLRVGDNGRGLPPDFDLERSRSFGLKLVKGLTHQLNGELFVKSSPGAQFTIRFKASE